MFDGEDEDNTDMEANIDACEVFPSFDDYGVCARHLTDSAIHLFRNATAEEKTAMVCNWWVAQSKQNAGYEVGLHLMKRLYSMMASSVPSERVFSTCTALDNPRGCLRIFHF